MRLYSLRMTHEDFMRRAIDLAYLGQGLVSPNPMVGAVLVHQGSILGEGFHAGYGQVHAEVAALQTVSDAQRGLIPESTLYVSLEPCAHQGKQPPCANRIVAERIKKVVIATLDPYKEVQGRGLEILQQAGVAVEVGCMEQEARWLARRFFTVQERSRPYIILKWAQSAEGYFAPLSNARKQLSNAFSMELLHQWRRQEAAIMVGYKTALIDNPKLTNRSGSGLQPLRIVLDRTLALATTHHLMQDDAATWIINAKKEQPGLKYFKQADFGDKLLPNLLQDLKHHGHNSLIVEGGAQLLQAFIDGGLWDEARVIHTPVTLGKGLAAPLLKDAELMAQEHLDTDLLHVYQPSDRLISFVPGMRL